MKRRKKNAFAFMFALFASLLLFFSGTTGLSSWKQIESIVTLIINDPTIQLVFTIVFIISSFGGLAVLGGGVFILSDKIRWGRVLIMLGTGTGIFTLLSHIIIMIISKEFSLAWFSSSATIGIVLSIIASKIAKPKVS